MSPPNPCPSLLQRRGVVGLPESTADEPHLLLVGLPAEHDPGRHKLGLGHDLRTLSCCPSLGTCWSHRGAAAPSSVAGPWGPRAARRWGALVRGCARPQNQFCPPPTPTTSLSWVSPGPALGCCPRGGNEPPGSSCCLLSPLLHRGTGGGWTDRQMDGQVDAACCCPSRAGKGLVVPGGSWVSPCSLGSPLPPPQPAGPWAALGDLGGLRRWDRC